MLYTLGTMCNLSLGIQETHYTHFIPIFVSSFISKKKKMHVYVCLQILVDLKNYDLIFMGVLKTFEHMIW